VRKSPRRRSERPVSAVRRGLEEDSDAALDRHFAAYPEDQDANVVIFQTYGDVRGGTISRCVGNPGRGRTLRALQPLTPCSICQRQSADSRVSVTINLLAARD
jgi:hypothetical protein